MGRIHRLAPEIRAKIAAGEVIEGPASVVKELLENSLDARAGKIVLRIDGAGLSLISVSDDGVGILPDDMPLALERHSTSKLSSEADLLKIKTLGFRGEALASICAVSKVRVISRAKTKGYSIECVQGQIGALKEHPHPRGTTVEVRDLFFNFPVRRKFLPSPSSMLREISRVFISYSLAHPEVHFILIREGREVANYPPGSLKERISQVLGKEFLANLREIETQWGEVKVYGFSSAPGKGRPRPQQFFFLNRRPIYNKELFSAFKTAYSGLIQSPNLPEGVIFLEAPPSSYDVNIHPTKREVKFKEPSLIYRLFRSAIKGDYTSTVPSPASKAMESSTPSYGPAPKSLEFQPTQEEKDFRVLGQARGIFIIVERDDGLYLVDQHNAMERALYEKLKKGKISSQNLLIPVILDLSEEEALLLEQKEEELRKAGFDFQRLSGRSLALKAHPSIIPPERAEKVFLEALKGKDPVLATVACRASVKRGEVLSIERMENIVAELFQSENFHVCPHGRPIIVKLSWEELAKKIGRREV